LVSIALRGENLIKALDENLSDYATKNLVSLCENSRHYPEEWQLNDTRTPFQHDRDRIIHSRAFRRLRGKTQVFVATINDHYRTRLSHTLEVTQMSRSIARVFRLNEDLTEAIALGHDLGHTPFGHAGERTLDELLKRAGGFRHNYNSLKVVDSFERYLPSHPGLNLTRWVREGILKHTDTGWGSVTDQTLDLSSLHPDTRIPSFLEGQIVAVCDEIAQVTHDLEDAVRAGLLQIDRSDLRSIDVYQDSLPKDYLDESNRRSRLIRNLIANLIEDLIGETKERLRKGAPPGTVIVALSDSTEKQRRRISDILWISVYSCQQVARMDEKGVMVIRKLYEAYRRVPTILPDYVYRKYEDVGGEKIDRSLQQTLESARKDDRFSRIIAEHIAGMTDQYAICEYNDALVPSPLSQMQLNTPSGIINVVTHGTEISRV
jgi:dGTPase